MKGISRMLSLSGVALLAALVVVLSGLQAETAEAARTKNLWVEPLTFTTWNDAAEFTFNGPNLYGTNLYAVAPLPARRRITGITIYYLDNVANDLCVTLSIHPAGAANWLPMGAACSSGASAQASSSQLVLPTAYKLLPGDSPFLHVIFGAYDINLQLTGVAVQYR